MKREITCSQDTEEKREDERGGVMSKQRLFFLLLFCCNFQAAAGKKLDLRQHSVNRKSLLCVGTDGIRQLWIQSPAGMVFPHSAGHPPQVSII